MHLRAAFGGRQQALRGIADALIAAIRTTG